MNKDEAMQMALDTLSESKRSHYYCEDRFYSCPKHEEGCANDLDGDECNCGVNFINETIEKAIQALRTALAQPDVPETAFGEIKPVAWMYDWTTSEGEFIQDWTTSEAETLRDTKPNIISNIRPLYTQPHREWVGLTDAEAMEIEDKSPDIRWAIIQAEAKLKEKNT